MRGEMSLYDAAGARKYVNLAEGQRFVSAATKLDARRQAFCLVLALTGCRVSEALALTQSQIDDTLGCLSFRTLKRRKLVYRQVPVPDWMMHNLLALEPVGEGRLFPWCRQTGYRIVKRTMLAAGIEGACACPKGLRHRFGVVAGAQRVPPGVLMRWLGHANLKTTVLYQECVGEEERLIAERMWTDVADILGE